ncbi:helix-turn-helix transcriptional regulator [Streptomyces sp. NPDC059814]|uniref:helix-turn-helix transcriptional regulator n=1 Tax=unclassified Streptomyces TaxID=2593676 RepID=UPI003669DC25
MTVSELEQFTAWIEDVIRRRGYDIDSPRGGGKSRLADEAGVHRAAITRLLQRQSMPDLETMRRLAHVLGLPVREMLIRSGRLTEDELPMPQAPDDLDRQNAGSERITLEEAATALGVPAEQREMFMRVAGQFLPADPVEQDLPARRTRRG